VSVARAEQPAVSVSTTPIPVWWRLMASRMVTFCIVELRKIRHDRTEIYTRSIQPMLWILIFGETFTRLHAIPSEGKPYLEYLAPGIMAQSAMFIAIFYGIQLVWERDIGILTKLLATPTPPAAITAGKAFAAGVRALAQVIAILALCLILRIDISWNPLNLLAVAAIVVLGTAFFATLSMTIAGLVMTRDRLMGIGQAITMPLFFASNALYPLSAMPSWLQAIARVNPLSYEVDALRGLLIGTPSNLWLDTGVLIVAAIGGIAVASSLLRRLARG
jgi:ABC-2 type transport system permease protein